MLSAIKPGLYTSQTNVILEHWKMEVFYLIKSLGTPYILVTNFWWSHQPNHQFQITNFAVSSHQNVLYYSVVIAGWKCLSQLNYIAHFGDLKQKNRWFEIGDLVGDFTKKLVTRMDGAP